MNKYLRALFASAYIVVTLLLLAGVVKHSAWFLAGLEPLADEGFGWVLAFALDGALVVSTCTLVSYQLRRASAPTIVRRAFWLFLLYSTVANLAHALAHNHLADWSAGVTWWYYFSSIIGAALLPTALAIMPHAAEAVLVASEVATLSQTAASETAEVPQPKPQIAASEVAESPQVKPQLATIETANLPQFAAAQVANLSQFVSTETANLPHNLPQIVSTEVAEISQIAALETANSRQVKSQFASSETANLPHNLPQSTTTTTPNLRYRVPQLMPTEAAALPQYSPQFAATQAANTAQVKPQIASTEVANLRQVKPQLAATEVANLSQELPQLASTEVAELPHNLPQIITAETANTAQLAAAYADDESASEAAPIVEKLQPLSRKRTPQTEPRTVAEIALALGISEDSVRRRLAALTAAGMAERTPGRPARYVVHNALLMKGA